MTSRLTVHLSIYPFRALWESRDVQAIDWLNLDPRTYVSQVHPIFVISLCFCQFHTLCLCAIFPSPRQFHFKKYVQSLVSIYDGEIAASVERLDVNVTAGLNFFCDIQNIDFSYTRKPVAFPHILGLVSSLAWVQTRL